MQFATMGSERLEASRGAIGTCPACESKVVAKCGEQRIWHWAHLGERNCDKWWEPETAWHRAWKNHFPREAQEVICPADSGERHIADVKTDAGLVIEFQHSAIAPSEQRQRETFYGNMVWVVNGIRLKSDLPRFMKGSRYLKQITQDVFSVFLTGNPAECFPRQWLEREAPVVFDFGVSCGDATTLWCLLPGRAEERAVVVSLSRSNFIALARTQPEILSHRDIVDTISAGLRARSKPSPLPQFERWLGRRQESRRRF